jgi:hypothetical protein
MLHRILWICLLVPLLLASAPAQGAESSPAQEASPSSEPTPEQRLSQYRRDQINLLALRADAPALLAAALLAEADRKDPHRPAALKPPALLARAQAAAADDPLVWWVSAMLDCHASDQPCPQVEQLTRLEQTDAQNAAVWLLALLRAQRAHDEPAARAALTSAAQAARYEDYFGRLVALLVAGERILPVEEEIIRASGQINASEDGYRLITAAGLVVRLLSPVREALATACHDAGAKQDLAADCLAVAKKMALAGSFGARNFGIRQWLAWLPEGADPTPAKAAQRSLAWQTSRIAELAERLADDPDVSRTYLEALTATGAESDAVSAVLRSQGIGLDPPAAWQPPAEGIDVP